MAKKAPLRVLYVENNAHLGLAFGQKFGSMLDITVVPDQEEALASLEEGLSPDLILLNGESGVIEFLKFLDSVPHFSELPVILISESFRPDLSAKPFKGHVIDVFPPNYSEEALRTRLGYIIQKKRYREAERPAHKSTKIRVPIGKRIFDIVVSFTALALLSPLLLVVIILIKLDSKGPIFYGSKRVGAGYKIFSMYKFRTMRTDADKMLAGMSSQNMYNKPVEEPTNELCDECKVIGACQRLLFLDNQQMCEKIYHRNQQAKAKFMKFKEDPRVTRLGKILRNTSIDELPQLYNILRGDMSFVGNRPLPPYEAEKLTATGYARRFAAPAGLTGLWQVTKRGKAKVSDLERIQLDVLYAKKYSFKTDLIIMIKTVKALFQKENV